MIKNYLKIAIRGLLRQKGYSVINLTGLALGMSLLMLIVLYIQFEISYDKFNVNYDRIHRVELNMDGRSNFVAMTHNPVGPTLARTFPEITAFTRFIPMGVGSQLLAPSPDKKFTEDFGLLVDGNFLEVFSYPLIRGNSQTALTEPFSVVLSKDLAEKYYPNEDPVGKILRLNNQHDLKVTGVVENCPANSHIRYQYLVSFATNKTTVRPDFFENWGIVGLYTYVLLQDPSGLETVNDKIKNLLKKEVNEQVPSTIYLKPLSQLHFNSNVLGEVGPRGDWNRVIIIAAIGLFIILIASVNYMNLSTARSVQRSKEVGIRKVIGAVKKDLILQFLGESLLLSFLSLCIAFILALVFLPEFNQIVQRNLALQWNNWTLWAIMAVIMLLTGVLSGSYPAFYLSRFDPSKIFRGTGSKGVNGTLFRKSLVVFQFAICVALMTGALVIRKQIHFMRTADLGYTKENIMVIEAPRNDAATYSKFETLKNRLNANPDVIASSFSKFVPTLNRASSVILDWEGRTSDERIHISMNDVDKDFLKTYDIPLTKGRFFYPGEYHDSANVCLINETAAKRFGWVDPVGKTIQGFFKVTGVVKDFHFTSLQRAIEPIMIKPLNNASMRNTKNLLSVRLSASNQNETIRYVTEEFKSVFPEDIMQYRFLDQDFDIMYRDESRMAKTVGYFSLFAVLIACLGLFGLASFTAERRTKEIGIRKVLGASTGKLVLSLTGDFAKWVLIANVIAWPSAYFLMDLWLQNFAYRTDIGAGVFLLTGITALITALLTVSYQSFRAATVNPVKSLRYE